MTMATNTMMTTPMLTTATMVRRQWLAVAGGSGEGQQRWQRQGLSVHIFLIETEIWVLLVVGKGQGEADGKP
jgi:hypothetical protein